MQKTFSQNSPRFIILLGPHGSGKGTQARMLSSRFGISHLSTGNLIRREIGNGTSLSELAKSYLDKGDYLPDDIMNKFVSSLLKNPEYSAGAIFDGYPRTKTQAEFLDSIISDYIVVYLNIKDASLQERFRGRLICTKGHVFHKVFNPPKIAGKCDIDGLPLSEREDDTNSALIDERIRNYHKLSEPLILYYREKGILVEVDADKQIEEVFKDIINKISIYDRTAK